MPSTSRTIYLPVYVSLYYFSEKTFSDSNKIHVSETIENFPLLSTHADRQGVDCGYIGYCLFVCAFVRLRIYPPGIKLVASNFTRWFRGVLGRESPILGKFAPPKAQNQTKRRAASGPRIGMCG